MRPLLKLWTVLLLLPLLLSSCEFNCRIGRQGNNNGSINKDGATVYNSIDLNSTDVKVKKAWLMFESGERVPADNFIDFKTPVQLILEIDMGWSEQDGKVWIGASERIVDDQDREILNEEDLFADYSAGVSAEDAKYISLTADIKLRNTNVPQSFDVFFKVWDKRSDAKVTGKYSLHSK